MSKEQNNFGLSVHDPFKSSLCVSVSSRELQCSTWPVGALHPVRAQLERFEAGPGCAAREGGAKDTHVISVGKASNNKYEIFACSYFSSWYQNVTFGCPVCR